MKYILYSLALVLCYCSAIAEQITSSTVSGVWSKQKSPYYIHNNIEIPDDSTLVIEAGVDVVFLGKYKLQVSGSLVAKGTAQDSIYFSPSDTVVGWRGLQIDNSNLGSSGSMNNNDSSIFHYCVFTGAKNTTDNFYRGAAFYVREFSKVSIAHSSFRKNYSLLNTLSNGSGKGAGLFLRDTKASVVDCWFVDNHVGDDGGALYVNNGGEIRSCYFKYNTAYEDGGAIAIFGGGTLVDCIVDSNSALTEEGGGVYIDNGATLYNCVISNNTAGFLGNGGGLYILQGNNFISSCTIEGNTCGKLGGGIYVNGKAQVNYCTIRSNKANEGGGVAFSTSSSTVDNDKLIFACKVQNNTAAIAGGIKSYYANVVNCLITNNRGTTIAGGYRGEQTLILNTTIANNESPNVGGLSSKSHNKIYNSIVWNNTAPQYVADYPTVDVQYCAIDGNIDMSSFKMSISLLNTSPSFVAPVSFIGIASTANMLDSIDNADWRLLNGSVLVNSANHSLYSASFLPYDLDSNARLQKGEMDMGAYESTFDNVSISAIPNEAGSQIVLSNVVDQSIIVKGDFSIGTLYVYSINGMLLNTYSVSPNDIISLRHLAPGVMSAILKTDNNVSTHQIINR